MPFVMRMGHWKKDCLKLKKRDKGKSMSDTCVIERGLVGHQTIAGFL